MVSRITIPHKESVYAPIDIAVSIATGVAARGHEVVFYAPRGSSIPGVTVKDCNLEALSGERQGVSASEMAKIHNLWDQYLIAQMYAAAERGEHDILHIHPIDRALPLAYSHLSIPTLYTLHDPISEWRAEVFRMFAAENQKYVSISDAQRKPAPDLNYAATVYNGLELTQFPFNERGGNEFIFVGRLVPDKGVSEAIAIAQETGITLRIIGSKNDEEYFRTAIEPHLSETIIYEGYKQREELYRYYQGARALLFPLQWDEPFGLTMTETMACGTPVVAYGRGSVPEIVENGVTGYSVSPGDTEGFARATSELAAMDDVNYARMREACRARVEKLFSAEAMVAHYEAVYRDMTGKS